MNKIELKKPLVFFDIESTGLHVIRDRIIQIGLIKYSPDREDGEELELLINPGAVLISAEALAVHGISSSDLANKPTFNQVAQQLFDFIGEADLAGYNSDRFDIPMLMEEFARHDYDFNLNNRRTIDVQKIFYKMEPRTLTAAYRFYCQKEMEGAHDALADVRATAAVLTGQLERYKESDYSDGKEVVSQPIQPSVESLSTFTTNASMLDVTQRLKYASDGTVVFNFGKYMGRPVAETLYKDKAYFNWIQNKEFSVQVKQITKELRMSYEESNQKK